MPTVSAAIVEYGAAYDVPFWLGESQQTGTRQHLAPVLDVSQGGWSSPSNPGYDFYATLNEPTPDDSTYIASGQAPVGDTVEVKFAPAVNPGVLDGFVVSYRLWGNSGMKVTVSLVCGTTVIRAWVHDPAPIGPNNVDGAPFWQFDQPLDPSEAALITNYADLRLRLVAAPASVSTVKNAGILEALYATDMPSVKGAALMLEVGSAVDTASASLPRVLSAAVVEAGAAVDTKSGALQSPTGSFKTVTYQGNGGYALPAGTPGQYITQLKLHGSSGGLYQFGEHFLATCDNTMGYFPDNPFTFWIQNVGGYLATPIGEIQPIDQIYTDATNWFESYWFGYSVSTNEMPKVAHPYTEARLDALYAWTLDNYPQLSRTKVTAYGNSMGAWGSMSYALRRPDKFAAIFATQPRWRDPYLPDWSRSAASAPLTPLPSGQLYGDHMDAVAYVANTNNKLPFISWTIGSMDEFAPWADQLAAYDALVATKRAFVFAWNGGNHGAEPAETIITSTYTRTGFELGHGYPILMNSSLNQNPHVDPVGGINLGFSWTNVVETAGSWSCQLKNTSACSVDVLPYSSIFTATVSPVRVTLLAGVPQTVMFTSAVPIVASMQENLTAADSTNAQVPSTTALTTNAVNFNRNRAVLFFDHHAGGQAYDRWGFHDVFTTNAVGVPLASNMGGGVGMVFCAMSVNAASAKLDLMYPEYRLFLSSDGKSRGTQRAVAHIPADSLTGPYDKGRAVFRGTLGAEADGPYMLIIVPYDAGGSEVLNPGESYVPFWIWIDRTGQARNHPMVVFQNSSYDWTHPEDWGDYTYCEPYLWSLVPKTSLKTRRVPLDWHYVPVVDADPQNTAFPGVFQGGEPFSDACAPNQLTRINFAYFGEIMDANHHMPCITKRGIVVTENVQSYFPTDWPAKVPQMPLLDGPRGVATMQNATSLWVGHSGVQYGTDSFAFWKIGIDGTKTTLAGLRHVPPYPPYWEERGNINANQQGRPYMVQDQTNIPGVEYVGDWTNVPGGNSHHFPWESWGIIADYRTTTQDYSVPQINLPPFGMLPPHLGYGPAFYTTCRQTSAKTPAPALGAGRILKYQFSKDAPTAPPVITEFATSVMDPWGIATDQNGTLFVTERTRHAISKWNLDTGAYLGDVIANPSAGSGQFGAGPFGQMLDDTSGWSYRRWSFPSSYYLSPHDIYNPDMSLTRAQPILAPEGCTYMDGYLYWAAYAQGEVRRINLATSVVEVCCRPPIYWNGQSNYIYISISDGTFGPRGTIFTSTYDNQGSCPRAWPPGAGVAADGTHLTNATEWNYMDQSLTIPRGPGGRYGGCGYITAGNIHDGMLVYSGSLPGLFSIVKATLGEPPTDEPKMTRGYQKWRLGYYRHLYGNAGYGFVDVNLPWGVDSDIDYYLQMCGHVYGS